MGLGTLKKGSGIYSGYILKVKGTGMRGRTQGWLRLDLKTKGRLILGTAIGRIGVFGGPKYTRKVDLRGCGQKIVLFEVE